MTHGFQISVTFLKFLQVILSCQGILKNANTWLQEEYNAKTIFDKALEKLKRLENL